MGRGEAKIKYTHCSGEFMRKEPHTKKGGRECYPVNMMQNIMWHCIVFSFIFEIHFHPKNVVFRDIVGIINPFM